MSKMWNSRYSQDEYVYGEEPNAFFKEHILQLQPGKILLPAEGEGRNAVFAAKIGWEVFAFDSSSEGKKKAEKLALKNNVSINYGIASYEDAMFEENSFDLIALIYAHSPSRQANHQKLIKFLKPGGIILLEGFSKNQIKNNTGGPKNIELLFSKEELQNDFAYLPEKKIWEEEIFLNEGKHHKGKASVIRLIGKKITNTLLK
ncbi:MAG: class I SAM-dependent methyltransferase [Saprospiraceae bacterium]|nr:class I SAM-dependent methyltransferase [Saprospiraceae bacterium]